MEEQLVTKKKINLGKKLKNFCNENRRKLRKLNKL